MGAAARAHIQRKDLRRELGPAVERGIRSCGDGEQLAAMQEGGHTTLKALSLTAGQRVTVTKRHPMRGGMTTRQGVCPPHRLLHLP